MISNITTRIALGLSAALLTASMAQATLRVVFDEGAPKDRFLIENRSDCTLRGSTVMLDLSTSQGALIFDVTERGAGVEVYQPFELVEGKDRLTTVPTVIDGQSKLQLSVDSLAPGEKVVFTIDVDDTIGQREITVSGAEIAGATVSFSQAGQTSAATFTSRASADLAIGSC
ncbi:MAG: aggregation factor core [Pseudomonadota bacterium]